jgi:hypothetical protein
MHFNTPGKEKNQESGSDLFPRNWLHVFAFLLTHYSASHFFRKKVFDLSIKEINLKK